MYCISGMKWKTNLLSQIFQKNVCTEKFLKRLKQDLKICKSNNYEKREILKFLRFLKLREKYYTFLENCCNKLDFDYGSLLYL